VSWFGHTSDTEFSISRLNPPEAPSPGVVIVPLAPLAVVPVTETIMFVQSPVTVPETVILSGVPSVAGGFSL
jgi:hypothetical protein